jgi:hypothetical protein
MAEPNKNPQDDHIEDLLSQLQGIFGKLSRQEEEESKDKLDAPAAKPEAKPVPAPVLKPEPQPEPKSEPKPEPTPEPKIELTPPAAPSPAPVPPNPSPSPAPSPAPEPITIQTPAGDTPIDDSTLITGIAYPAGRDAEAKALAGKLESLTPRFTKVSFHLKVMWTLIYDPKSDWKEAVVNQIATGNTKAFFLVVERPLDDTRRRALAAEMESRSVYLQEVPALSIEKKAFYTDVLLGLVFFFDSMKPSNPDNSA